ncbi:PLP-dependent aminotransferase family protein [Salinarimonas sp.]|uniref:aminotransferase-like domain-containing protein n=1 Tax=Salinarimonas sp. TaxID=2766526 RepID=UPI00391A09C4
MRLASPWTPRLAAGAGPVSERLAEALAEDIVEGRLPTGARLPAHRDLAWRLGIGIGTVTKAYGALARRGLVRAARGRAMFVAPPPGSADGLVDLSRNAPPSGLTRRLVATTLAALAKRLEPDMLALYLPAGGRACDREAMARWLAELGLATPPDRLFLVNGAQQALAIAFHLAAGPRGPILTEALTYPGAIALAAHAGRSLVPVAIDAEGLVPDALEAALAACARAGERPVAYVTPTLHNPTTATMGAARREAIVALARRFDALLVEDDVYAFSADGSRPPLAALAPERVLYATSLSKTLSPGLRIGALVVPPGFEQAAEAALVASAASVSPLSCAVLAYWLADGAADAIRAAIREEAAARVALARRAFERAGIALALPQVPGFHAFLPLPRAAAERLAGAAAAHGIRVTPPDAVSVDRIGSESGIRLCLGAPPVDRLGDALTRIAELARDVGEERLVVAR